MLLMSYEPDVLGHHLRQRVSCPVHSDPVTLSLYSTDASIYQIRPACVVLPQSTEDIVACVQYAAETDTPIVARGAGSGLAGETLTHGIVLDFSRYLDRVIETDLDAGWVRCQPGVVLERLNAALGALGHQFGPDPSSANRATVGGVIANNATGAHSIKYGYTDAHIEELTVVLANAHTAIMRSHLLDLTPEDAPSRIEDATAQLVRSNQTLIEAHTPRVRRHRSGYALHKVIHNGRVDLCRLIAGSEGTLAIITEAKLRFVDRPTHRGLLQFNFDSLLTMARTVPQILNHNPGTCELMDGKLLEMARSAYPQHRHVLPHGVAASLLVEHDGATVDEVRRKLERTQLDIRGPIAADLILDPGDQRAIWSARKAAVPLLYRKPGLRQPVPFIEDVAVPPDRLGEFIPKLDTIFARHGVDVVLYGHAGDGEFHIRPYLNLRDPTEVAQMRSLATETFRLAWSLGGTISGEHGDGLVRTEFMREQFGPLYEVMRQVKQVFDPHNILNPGKIINEEPGIMTQHLRFEQKPLLERRITPRLAWKHDDLIEEIERCNGNAECRSLEVAGTMCPVFRATHDEIASPRAHANLLRDWITGQLDESFIRSDEFKAAIATCLQCKSCRQQCPSAVNIPKLMLEARSQYAARRGLTPTEWLLSHSDFLSLLGSATAPLANLMIRSGLFRSALERLTGIDRRRPMPAYAWRAFVPKAQRWLRANPLPGAPVGRVALFADLYANYHDHELAWSILRVLRHNRIEVVVPDQDACHMPAICYGDIDSARERIVRTLSNMAGLVRDGYTIVSGEPTATLCLRQEYLDLLDGQDARIVAENTQDLCEYLWALHNRRQLRADLAPMPISLAYHCPCHLAAMEIGLPGLQLLQLIPQLRVKAIGAGCCGLAGTFGFQQRNFETSVAAGSRLADALGHADVEAGATECATCKMQMEFLGRKKVWHPMVLLARSYGLHKSRS